MIITFTGACFRLGCFYRSGFIILVKNRPYRITYKSGAASVPFHISEQSNAGDDSVFSAEGDLLSVQSSLESIAEAMMDPV